VIVGDENMREKGQRAASKMFRDTNANSSFSPVDFSNIGKFTPLAAKSCTQNTFLCVFASILIVLEIFGSICCSK